MGKDDYCIWNASSRKIVFRPMPGVVKILQPFPGKLRCNRDEFMSITRGGFFVSLEGRGQISTRPISKTSDTRTSDKSAPEDLKPKVGPQGKNSITHTVKDGGSVDDVINVQGSEKTDPVSDEPDPFGTKSGNKGGNKSGNKAGK